MTTLTRKDAERARPSDVLLRTPVTEMTIFELLQTAVGEAMIQNRYGPGDPRSKNYWQFAERLLEVLDAAGMEIRPIAPVLPSQIPGVDATVTDEARRAAPLPGPEWLWYGDESGDVTLGRWGTKDSSVPYVRADLVLAQLDRSKEEDN